MRYLGLYFILIVSILCNNAVYGEVAGEHLWSVKHQWNLEWESKYKDWLSENLTKDFFVKYNIEVNCADVIYSLRWIFSRIHALPAAATLKDAKTILSHESMRSSWLKLPTHKIWHKDLRFLKAIDYLNDNTSTRTLLYDAYPVSIESEAVDVGTMFLTPGHVEIISKLNKNGDLDAPIYRLDSTTPQKVRMLHENTMLEFQNVKRHQGGILNFRWPKKIDGKWTMTDQESMPFFSIEQYHLDFSQDEGFSLSLARKLNLMYDPEKVIFSSIQDVVNYVEFRKVIVEDGYNYCQKHNCNTNNWMRELHATSGRDRKLTKKMDRVYKLVNYFSKFNPEFEYYIEKYFLSQKVVILDRPITLKKLHQIFKEDRAGHDPRESLLRRWGLENGLYVIF